MKSKLLGLVIALLSLPIFADGQVAVGRYDAPLLTLTVKSPVAGNMYPVFALPGATIQVCSTWTPGIAACNSLLQTYTQQGAGQTTCPTNAQLIPALGGSCSSTTDSTGNIGLWAPPGAYAYVITPSFGQPVGPYSFAISAGGTFFPFSGGTLTGGITGPSATFNSYNGLESQNYLTAARQPLAQGLFRLRASLPSSVVGPTHIVILGDSQTICESQMSNCLTGPGVPTNRWADLVRIQLQNFYGSHGTGVTPLINNVTWNIPNPQFYTTTGTFSQAVAFGIGPSQTSSFATGYGLGQLSTGATLTFTSGIAWDHLNIYCGTNSGSGSMSYQIDGGGSSAVTPCNSPTGSPTAHLFTSGAVALNTHVSTITCNTGPCYIYAEEGTAGTTGVSVDNLAVATAAAEFFGTASSQLAFSDLIPNVELVLVDLGTNDVNQNFGYTSTSYANALTQIITHERSLGTPPPSVFMIMPPVSSIANSSNWGIYTAAMQGVVNTQNTAFVNIQDRWGTTTSAAYYSQYFCSDQVHPCDFGSIDEFTQISSYLADAYFPLPVTIGSNSFTASTFVDRPGNAFFYASCNNSITGYSSTQAFCDTGVNFQAPGTNNYSLALWGGTPNSAGQGGVIGLFDQTTAIFDWNIDLADNFCLGTPVSGGNVGTCAGAAFIYNRSLRTLGIDQITNLQNVTFTLQAAAGSSATLGGVSGCFTNVTCSPSFGWLIFSPAGSGITTGDLVKVSWPFAWSHDAACIFQSWDGSTNTSAPIMIQDGTNMSTTFFYVSAPGTAPTTAHQYIVIYHCE